MVSKKEGDTAAAEEIRFALVDCNRARMARAIRLDAQQCSENIFVDSLSTFDATLGQYAETNLILQDDRSSISYGPQMLTKPRRRLTKSGFLTATASGVRNVSRKSSKVGELPPMEKKWRTPKIDGAPVLGTCHLALGPESIATTRLAFLGRNCGTCRTELVKSFWRCSGRGWYEMQPAGRCIPTGVIEL